MKITKPILESYLVKAIELLEDSGVPRYKIRERLGLTYEDLTAIEMRDVEVALTDDERHKIAREVDTEDKLQDIVMRVRELWDGESLYLHGFTAEQILGNSKIMHNILNRYEKALGWQDNSSYWELLDYCIGEETSKELAHRLINNLNNGG